MLPVDRRRPDRRRGVARAIGGVAVTAALLAMPPGLAGQVCEPIWELEDVIRNVEASAAGEQSIYLLPRDDISYFVIRAFSEECPRLLPTVDRGQALMQLLLFAIEHEDRGVAGPVLSSASRIAYQQSEDLQIDSTNLLFEAVTQGRTGAVRWQAALRLVERAEDPGIRARLLALLRAPAGPPAWPELPVDLVPDLPNDPTAGGRRLLEEVLAAPGLLQHPWARWRVECGLGVHEPPREQVDPCHPQNAPPRGGGG